MMILDKIDKFIQEYKSILLLSEDATSTLEEKFRLEFNYNSNNLEGNTISYIDTKILLLKDLVGNTYTMRELDEMRAHDVAFSIIKSRAIEQGRFLTEQDIKELNQIILVKPFWKDAQTPDGLRTRKEITIGEYKTMPNHVRLANGKIFKYAEPIEVPARMAELLDWYRSEEKSLHIVKLIAMLHHKFVLIHPFDDGNGRISRLLVNYVLIKNGLPPIVIKSANKKDYLNALQIADAGNFEPFILFMAEQLKWSLELCIAAAKGESIEEENDWEKELSILSKSKKNAPEARTIDITFSRLKDSVFPLFRIIENASELKIMPLFKQSTFSSNFGDYDATKILTESKFVPDNLYIDIIKGQSPNVDQPQIFTFAKTFLSYQKNGINDFNVQEIIKFVFGKYSYKISFENDPKVILEKMNSEPLSDEDINKVVNLFGKKVTEGIKAKINKI